jgi:hypothetical protein
MNAMKHCDARMNRFVQCECTPTFVNDLPYKLHSPWFIPAASQTKQQLDDGNRTDNTHNKWHHSYRNKSGTHHSHTWKSLERCTQCCRDMSTAQEDVAQYGLRFRFRDRRSSSNSQRVHLPRNIPELFCHTMFTSLATVAVLKSHNTVLCA